MTEILAIESRFWTRGKHSDFDVVSADFAKTLADLYKGTNKAVEKHQPSIVTERPDKVYTA